MATELIKSNGLVPLSLDSAPDYLPSVVGQTGLEGLGKDDIKTPRILLLQGLSPQLENFPTAKKDHFWHTGLNVSLGSEFLFVPAMVNKRVILWRPRTDEGGGILAFSVDGRTWATGGNQEFRVRLKGMKNPVVWKTGKDVMSSGLTEFGSANPEDGDSPPAATVSYEYLCYLPEAPELSPCVLGVSKTGLPNAKGFNTSLAMMAKQGKPTSCLLVKCFAQKESNNDGDWTTPNFKLAGYAPKEVYEHARKLAETYADYKVEYSQDDEAKPKSNKRTSNKANEVSEDDEIPF